jgi:replicative superfamily II helicase
MIEIHGLSERQREIADMLWTLASTQELREWFDSLDRDTLFDAYIVHQMMLLAFLDQEPLGRMKEANQIIDRIRHI